MSLWNKVKKAAKKVAKKAKQAADWVEDKATEAGNAVGNAIEELGDAIGGVLGENRFGDSVKHVFSAIGSSIKGICESIGVGIGALIKTSVGLAIFDFRLFGEGVTDVVSSFLGTIILGAGHTLGLLGTLITIQDPNLRKLTKKEKEMLRRVFKGSLDYKVIKVHEGSSGFLGHLTSRPFAIGNTIYFKHNHVTAELMVHECTHVWQYQNRGNRYVTDAIYAQWFVPDEYDWEREINVRNKNNWIDFNGEAQAKFCEDVWLKGELTDSSGALIELGNGRFYDANWQSELGRFEITHNYDDGTSETFSYTDIARQAVNTIRQS
jgi:hypothetical protein